MSRTFRPDGPVHPTYALVLAQFGYHLDQQWSATLTVNNLLDKTHHMRVPATFFGFNPLTPPPRNTWAAMIIDSRFIRRLLAIVLMIAPPEFAGARGASSVSHETRIAACIRQVSGGRSWLEKTLWGLRDKEGGWVGAEVPNSDGSHDLGPLQINSWWVTRIADKVQRPPNMVRYWLVNDCGSAWKRDPGSGVIGVEKGPLIPVV